MSKQAIANVRAFLDRAEASRALVDLSADHLPMSVDVAEIGRRVSGDPVGELENAMLGIADAHSTAQVVPHVAAARRALDVIEAQMDAAPSTPARPSRPPAESRGGRARAKRASRAKGGK